MGVLATCGTEEKQRLVEQEVARHGGNPLVAVQALLEEKEQLEIQLDGAWALVSGGYIRRRQPEPPADL